MTIAFRCASCEKLFKVADDLAGRKAKCSVCGALMAIPETSEVEEEDEEVVTEAADDMPPPKKRKGRSQADEYEDEDADDRPRKKKRRKKSSGSSAAVVVSIAGVLGLLIVGGVGAALW